jgi:hypothetical protein
MCYCPNNDIEVIITSNTHFPLSQRVSVMQATSFRANVWVILSVSEMEFDVLKLSSFLRC